MVLKLKTYLVILRAICGKTWDMGQAWEMGQTWDRLTEQFLEAAFAAQKLFSRSERMLFSRKISLYWNSILNLPKQGKTCLRLLIKSLQQLFVFLNREMTKILKIYFLFIRMIRTESLYNA